MSGPVDITPERPGLASLRVSVVIPVYNRAHTIEHAIRSVLEQSDPVLEVIAVDDGSIDNSEAVIRAIDDKRVRFVRQPNGGAGSARNRALDLACGDWIAFLDSDDWWGKERIASAAALVAADPSIDFLQANRLHVYDDGHVDAGLKAPPQQMRDAVTLVSGFTIKTSAVMIRRSLVEGHALRFPTDQKTCEDYHLFWRAVVFARAVGFSEAPDVMIRALPDSLSRGNSLAYLQKDNIKTLIEVRAWAMTEGARKVHVDALTNHLHWQFRDYFVMLIKSGSMAMLLRYTALAARHEGLMRGLRGLASAVLGMGTAPRSVQR